MLMMRPQPCPFINGMTARQQRSAPTYFTLKSSSKSSSTTVSIGPVAVAEPPGADPLLTKMCSPPQLPRRLGDRALHLFPAGDIGGKRDDAPVRLMRKLTRRCLQALLVARDDRHIHALARQFPRNGLADAPAAAGDDGMFALQSEIHGKLPPVATR